MDDSVKGERIHLICLVVSCICRQDWSVYHKKIYEVVCESPMYSRCVFQCLYIGLCEGANMGCLSERGYIGWMCVSQAR